MRSLILSIGLVVLFSQTVLAHKYKTADFCQDEQKAICLHLGHDELPSSQKPWSAMVHFLIKAPFNAQEISNVEVWTVHSDDDGEVNSTTVTKKSADHYLMTQGRFDHAGTWVVLVRFHLRGQMQQIEVPVSVQ